MDGLGDIYVLQAAMDAFQTILQPERLLYICIGVLVGLAIGLLPGIGGHTGFALLIPFTYTMEPIAAFGMLLGMASVTATSDTIPAVLFGVPGTASSQATVLDGLPMTRRGEAGRALSAAYVASLTGGLFGALILGLTIPIVRPFVLAIGSPELLAMSVFGIAMVAALSGNTPLRGMVAACFGIMVGMIGTEQQTGTLRWAGEVLYLWDGVPLLPILLGIFALPELADLAVRRGALSDKVAFNPRDGMLQGVRDCVKNWFLILRCSGLGALLGAIPGISGSVTDWLVYGHAIRTEKGASETFSKGDVRGVIAPESANNARDGGALIPTLAFGVPGSASMAILLGALMVHGFVPGPDMLTRNLEVTYSMAWSIAVANIVGAGLCFGLSGQFAKISTLRYTLVLPAIMAIVYVGAFQGSRNWGDLYTLLIFGVIGWTMKRLRWPRPPVILGLVLGGLIERYMKISILRFEWEWLLRPLVMILLILALLALFRPMIAEIRRIGVGNLVPRGRPSFRLEDLVYAFFLVLAGVLVYKALDWPFGARIGPVVIGTAMMLFAAISLFFVIFARSDAAVEARSTRKSGIHMDLASEVGDLPPRAVALRGAQFFGWLLVFMASMAVIGLIPTTPLFIVAFMRLEGRERWPVCLGYAVLVMAFVYLVFDRIISVPWPSTILGEMFPVLANWVPSL
ncbi:tripartite tricarboxylate transporter permease [Chelativorans xinjiangense]|uniref:tripartite tricarboxylate transporter permease n=1 Tax=Chelativorans xinjiangense TaxID=2681485 RepID=UPI00135ADDAE|nr:tripartite tricarboxylate transporter permease [Chelativorans xinjiangense]